MKRRHLLYFFGTSLGTLALGSCQTGNRGAVAPAGSPAQALPFTPVRGPLPLATDGLKAIDQVQDFQTYEIIDDLLLPEGFTYDVLLAWGDPVGDGRAGYNNDFLAFVETAPGEGWLTVNFEYISGKAWMQACNAVLGKLLPFAEVQAGLQLPPLQGAIDAIALSDDNLLKAQIRAISEAALEDQGIGVIFLKRSPEGIWQRSPQPGERRISGISGLRDRDLRATGPAVAIFNKADKQGYDDGLGDRIVGTFGNCAGGTTPWGTVLSAEENFQVQVPEPVYADGSSFPPAAMPFVFDGNNLLGQGNVLGLAGNKYGYMVEVDPANPEDYGTKHTWLGRYRHEAVAVRAEANAPLAVYSGCDRRGGHLYKFVSSDAIADPKDKQNSKLFASGTLYAARFEPDGTGRWIPLRADTAIAPIAPESVFSKTVMLPKRPEGGYLPAKTDADAATFARQFATLGDLYTGTPEEKQGAILIDAHYAANAIGATATARPEDTDLAGDGSVFVAFTSGSPDEGTGGPDAAIFAGPNGEAWEYGWIFRLQEDGDDPAAETFTWEKLAMGGEPAKGGAGFSNPDNLLVDRANNLWMVTDISTSKHNNPDDKKGRGNFGNNSIWFIPTSGDRAGEAYLFGTGPMECEMTGPFFAPDSDALFLSVQHPGETNGARQNGAVETRKFSLTATEGQEFFQTRTVPVGSNWPSKSANDFPKPAVVAVRRSDGGAIV